MRLSPVLVLVLLSSGAACDELPTAPTRQDLAGRWIAASLHPAGGTRVVPRESAPLAVEFVEDRIGVQSDCNMCSGRFALTDGAFSVSPLACTRRACSGESLEGPFLDLLSTAETAAIASSALLLEGPRGTIVFRR